jgi:UDP-4-amino-4,6-dideoxy-N-acetyl-beta-L-altrosamine transaminase
VSLLFLPYGRQTIEDDDIEAVVDALRSDLLTTGPRVAEFESAFSAKVGAAHAVACSSGTAALHLAALALGLGPGDAVIVPSVTFLATANSVRCVGAEVVFADVDPETGLMGPSHLEEALSRLCDARARAVFPVHLNGQPVEMESISDIAERNGLAIVEDACHALGGTYRNTSIGACANSTMACFSTHPVKAIATGEGGLVTTNDPRFAKSLRTLRNHGITREPSEFANRKLAFADDGCANPWYYEMHHPGLNYRLSDINCALGVSQLAKLDRFLDRRRALADLYDCLLARLAPVVRPLSRVAWGHSGWHLYVVRIDFESIGIDRAAVIARLRSAEIGTQVHYLPLHHQPYYLERYGQLSLSGADLYYSGVLSLPFFSSMTEEDVERVVDALFTLIDKH